MRWVALVAVFLAGSAGEHYAMATFPPISNGKTAVSIYTESDPLVSIVGSCALSMHAVSRVTLTPGVWYSNWSRACVPAPFIGRVP